MSEGTNGRETASGARVPRSNGRRAPADAAADAAGIERAQLERLLAAIRPHERVLVALSGGTDSALVAWAARAALGDRALAVTGVSPSLAVLDRAAAERVAARIGIAHRWLVTRELDAPAYRANAGDRCYHCKAELYGRLRALADAEGFRAILDGTNTDDVAETLPGLRAARERQVVSPLAVAGLDKAAVRRLSRRAGLPTWDTPANACLASRIPVGTPVSTARLRRVETAERALRRLGFRQVRVRDEGERGRVEIGAAELTAARLPETAARIEEHVRRAGFRDAWIDPAGYRRGGADRDG